MATKRAKTGQRQDNIEAGISNVGQDKKQHTRAKMAQIELASMLRKIRYTIAVTQDQMARDIGRGERIVQAWESGEQRPSPSSMGLILDYAINNSIDTETINMIRALYVAAKEGGIKDVLR